MSQSEVDELRKQLRALEKCHVELRNKHSGDLSDMAAWMLRADEQIAEMRRTLNRIAQGAK